MSTRAPTADIVPVTIEARPCQSKQSCKRLDADPTGNVILAVVKEEVQNAEEEPQTKV